MYNRYIRGEDGGYRRVPVADGPRGPDTPPVPPPPPPPPPPRHGQMGDGAHWEPPPPPPDRPGAPMREGNYAPPSPGGPGPLPHGGALDALSLLSGRPKEIYGWFRDKLRLVDKGDLFLVLLLLFLYEENADEELLVALALLLIL